jgi:holin-like protein
MTGYLKVLLYLSAGEVVVNLTGFPIPGPMVGLALMLVDFGLNGQADGEVEQIFDRASCHLAVLFVPAGAGIIAHGAILSAGLPIILISVFAGTMVTMLVTAFCFRALLAKKPHDGRSCLEPCNTLKEIRS